MDRVLKRNTIFKKGDLVRHNLYKCRIGLVIGFELVRFDNYNLTEAVKVYFFGVGVTRFCAKEQKNYLEVLSESR